MPKVTDLTLLNYSNSRQIQSNYKFDKYRSYIIGFKNGPPIMDFSILENNILKKLKINEKYTNLLLDNVCYTYYNNNIHSSDQNLINDFNKYKDLIICTKD
jgi:hypothetical protein